MSGHLHYANNVRNSGPSNVAETFGMSEQEWHTDASGDTGTSHSIPGRLYVVQCEWCYDAFAANTKREAMSMFREHEESMARPIPSTESEKRNDSNIEES